MRKIRLQVAKSKRDTPPKANADLRSVSEVELPAFDACRRDKMENQSTNSIVMVSSADPCIPLETTRNSNPAMPVQVGIPTRKAHGFVCRTHQ